MLLFTVSKFSFIVHMCFSVLHSLAIMCALSHYLVRSVLFCVCVCVCVCVLFYVCVFVCDLAGHLDGDWEQEVC